MVDVKKSHKKLYPVWGQICELPNEHLRIGVALLHTRTTEGRKVAERFPECFTSEKPKLIGPIPWSVIRHLGSVFSVKLRLGAKVPCSRHGGVRRTLPEGFPTSAEPGDLLEFQGRKYFVIRYLPTSDPSFESDVFELISAEIIRMER